MSENGPVTSQREQAAALAGDLVRRFVKDGGVLIVVTPGGLGAGAAIYTQGSTPEEILLMMGRLDQTSAVLQREMAVGMGMPVEAFTDVTKVAADGWAKALGAEAEKHTTSHFVRREQ